MNISSVATAVTLSGLILLGACSAKKDAADRSSNAPGGTTPTLSGATMPKPGLWEMTVSADGMPKPMKTQICFGESAPGTNPFAPPPQAGAKCTDNAVTKTSTGYAIDVECRMNGMTVSTKGDVSGDFSSRYKTVMHTKVSGPNIPASMQTERTSTAESKYIGACPAGIQPGTVRQTG